MNQAALIAVDWGTSNLRASLLDRGGQVLETRSAPAGVMTVREGRFADALLGVCGHWVQAHRVPMIASGMIGSRQGWQEAPYLDCPTGLQEAAACLTPVAVAPLRTMHIVPGLRCQDAAGQFDVMRGEETQIWGAQLNARACCVLPGTHSKWAWVEASGQISRFATYMTGELYGLLTQHGILGRLMVFGQQSPEDFDAGVRVGLAGHTQASHAVFAARTAGLMGTVAPQGLPDFLSGILIGVEIASAQSSARPPIEASITLIGDDDLCARYARALSLAGLQSQYSAGHTTTTGQWLVARAAGLLEPAP